MFKYIFFLLKDDGLLYNINIYLYEDEVYG